ncbi:MAG: flagellar basal body rod C-terminal domain-containing protein, partial [Methylococcaceae bacterium]
EASNVDLSEQLVQLIIAQQAYQANAQSITTEKTIMQTILNA